MFKLWEVQNFKHGLDSSGCPFKLFDITDIHPIFLKIKTFFEIPFQK